MSFKDELHFIRARVQPLHVILVTLLVLVAFLWVWYSFVFRVFNMRERQSLASIQVLEQQKKIIPTLQYQVDQLQQQHDQLRAQLQVHQRDYVRLDPYMRLERLFDEITQSNLRIAAFSPQMHRQKLFYERALFTFKVFGSFEQIMRFLKLFNARAQYAKFKQAHIEHQEASLLFQATIALYVIDPEGAHA